MIALVRQYSQDIVLTVGVKKWDKSMAMGAVAAYDRVLDFIKVIEDGSQGDGARDN